LDEKDPEPAIPFLKYVAVPKGGKRKNANAADAAHGQEQEPREQLGYSAAVSSRKASMKTQGLAHRSSRDVRGREKS